MRIIFTYFLPQVSNILLTKSLTYIKYLKMEPRNGSGSFFQQKTIGMGPMVSDGVLKLLSYEIPHGIEIIKKWSKELSPRSTHNF
jgi:hypothetical protein